jgi:hypothetical protein
LIEALPKNDAFKEVLNKYGDSLGLQGGISGFYPSPLLLPLLPPLPSTFYLTPTS